MSSLRIRRIFRASRAKVYRALTEPELVAKWRVPPGMSMLVHAFDARVGGAFRISLTYDSIDGVGKTSARTDTYHGRFVELVRGRRVVERLEFETPNPALQGEMTIAYDLADVDGGTELVAVHDGLPAGVPAADNDRGWNESLAKLAALVDYSSDAVANASSVDGDEKP